MPVHARYFNTLAYQATMFLIELFVSTFEMLIYGVILYSMSGLSGGLISEKFLYFWVRLFRQLFDETSEQKFPDDAHAHALLTRAFFLVDRRLWSRLRW